MTDSAQGGSPGRILLIEDDPVAAHFAMHVLGKRGGFDVRHTPDPAVALRLAGSQTWDLVLTDMELPGMTGRELLAVLRKLAPGMPVAVITAHEPSAAVVQSLRDEADEILQKPVRPDQLIATVTSLVAHGRATRRLLSRDFSSPVPGLTGDGFQVSQHPLVAHRAGAGGLLAVASPSAVSCWVMIVPPAAEVG